MTDKKQLTLDEAKGPRRKRELSTVPLDVLATSLYLTVPEGAAYLRFPSVHAFECWLTRRAVPRCRRGRTVLFFRRDLDAAVRPPHLPPPKKNEP